MDANQLKKAPSYLRLPFFETLCRNLGITFSYLDYTEDLTMSEIALGEVIPFMKKYANEVWNVCLNNDELRAKYHMLMTNAYLQAHDKPCFEAWSTFEYTKSTQPTKRIRNSIQEQAEEFIKYYLEAWEIPLIRTKNGTSAFILNEGNFDGKYYLNARTPLVEDVGDLSKWDYEIYFFVLMKLNEMLSLCNYKPIKARLFF